MANKFPGGANALVQGPHFENHVLVPHVITPTCDPWLHVPEQQKGELNSKATSWSELLLSVLYKNLKAMGPSSWKTEKCE